MNLNCIENIKKKIKDVNEKNSIKADGFMITNSSNIRYILGMSIEGYIYIEDDDVYVVTDSRYIEDANKLCTNNKNVICIDIAKIDGKEKARTLFRDKNILVEAKDVTLDRANNIKENYGTKEIIQTKDLVESVRIVKSKEEISYIKKACEITDKAFSYILTYIKPGMTEKEIKDELEYYMKKQGAEDISFSAIVASGPNSSKPHATAGNRKIEEKDIVLLDFGCKYNGYCSDMTRTIFVGGITDKQRKIYDIVKSTQQLVIDCIKENVTGKDIDDKVHEEFRKNDLEEEYLHSTGHGVGLDIHELPYVSKNSGDILKEGMVITDEPGLYFEDEFGIRIEDTLLVTKNGVYIFFESNKDIIII